MYVNLFKFISFNVKFGFRVEGKANGMNYCHDGSDRNYTNMSLM